MRRPMIFKPPLHTEHHGPAIVHLQSCAEELDTRLATIEALIATIKKWCERAVWAAVMGALLLANLDREQWVDLAGKLLVKLFGP
jgi:hypothetical protein